MYIASDLFLQLNFASRGVQEKRATLEERAAALSSKVARAPSLCACVSQRCVSVLAVAADDSRAAVAG